MNIHVFAVRYREDIRPFVKNFYSDPTLPKDEVKLTIINNYGTLSSESNDFEIINNALRPDFSTGHLSRNWNQALINGFKNLAEPEVDYVVSLIFQLCLLANKERCQTSISAIFYYFLSLLYVK